MDRYDNDSADEHILNFNVSDDALERAGAAPEAPAFTFNFCTYNYYQCGPIGSRG